MILFDLFSILLLGKSGGENYSLLKGNSSSAKVSDFNYETWPFSSLPESHINPPAPFRDPHLEAINREMSNFSPDEWDELRREEDEYNEENEQLPHINSSIQITPPPTSIKCIRSSRTRKQAGGISAVLSSLTSSAAGILTQPISGLGGLFSSKKIPPTTPLPIICRENNEVLYRGNCHALLKQGPCPVNHWLLRMNEGNQGTCMPTICSWPFVQFNISCVLYNSEEGCHPGHHVIVTRSGEVQCDCKPGHIFHSKDGNCYAAFSRGPCKWGQYFILANKSDSSISSNPTRYISNLPIISSVTGGSQGLEGKCVKNLCKKDRLLPLVCYNCEENEQCEERELPLLHCLERNSPCGQGSVSVDEETLEINCSNGSNFKENPPIIENDPLFKCLPGSRRHMNGNCQ